MTLKALKINSSSFELKCFVIRVEMLRRFFIPGIWLYLSILRSKIKHNDTSCFALHKIKTIWHKIKILSLF